MDEHDNYFGAVIFWLYIVAALACTATVISTLYEMRPPNHSSDAERERKIRVFGALAALSFATLSYNMLNVLLQSYTLWARERELSLADTSPALIWNWSTTSSLFEDFGNAIVQNSARYLWAEATLLATLGVCTYIGVEGPYRNVPRLWAFVGLGQILPISFTQNLFYIALLRRHQGAAQWRVPRNRIVMLTGAYCACLVAAPAVAETPWLIPQILLARALLVVLQVHKWSLSTRGLGRASTSSDACFDPDGLYSHLTLLTILCAIAQTTLAFLERSPTDVGRALFSHPAVSSLGCDFVLSIVSYLCWMSIPSTNDSSRVKRSSYWMR